MLINHIYILSRLTTTLIHSHPQLLPPCPHTTHHAHCLQSAPALLLLAVDLEMSRPPRRLFLHLSALSDEEYNTYLAALRDVIDDEDKLADGGMDNWSEEELENRVLGVREVRAWMKGRYRDVNDIDKVRLNTLSRLIYLLLLYSISESV